MCIFLPFRLNTDLSDEDRRMLLKAAGWKREDRTQQGEHVELWVAPGLDRYGYRHGGVSLATAWRKCRRMA